ncbi:MAG: hypothetical protein AAF266_08385 [Planctomycetota bacterium]
MTPPIATCGGLLAIGLLSFPGCGSGPSRVKAPDVDPEETAEALIEQYDTDGDGSIGSEELASCPAIRGQLSAYDRDRDNSVRPEEIAERLSELYSDRVGMFSIYARVTLKRRPLAGATVELIPEEGLTEAINSASGVTDARGATPLSMPEEAMPADLRGLIRGVQTGLYRVRITHPTVKLPAGVSDGTSLGVELTPSRAEAGLRFDL